MKEAQAQSFLGGKIKEHWNDKKHNGVYELKIVKLEKSKSLPFSSVKDHQVEALLKTKHEGMYHKIQDSPIFAGNKTRFNLKKPFDFFFIKGPAYVVICFYIPRKLKQFVSIDIDVWVNEIEISDRKSITHDRALEIGNILEF